MAPKLSPAEILRNAGRANAAGKDLLTIGLSVGAVGLAGAALGAVCPLCVVATPALLGFGLVQRLRGFILTRRARNPAGDARLEEPAAIAAIERQTP
jgi:hypothetical protein